MWPSLTLHGGKGDRGSMLLAADQLLFADAGAGSGTAATDVTDAADADDAGTGGSANPRKRKKSSRACDFCHLNHQPCDNSKPRCSYCIKHGKKACLYLRPQKKRGPAQGYRSALHTMRESAAAWGVATTLIPNLASLVAGYLDKPEGRRLVKAIKDPQQQDHFIQAWQQSDVFKLFFADDGDAGDGGDGGDSAYNDGDGGDEPSSYAASRRRITSAADTQDVDADQDNYDGNLHSRNGSASTAAPLPPLPPPPPPPMSAAAAAAAAAARPRPKSFQRLARPLPRPPPPRQQPPPAVHENLGHGHSHSHSHSHSTNTDHQTYTTAIDRGGGGGASSSGPSDGVASSSLADIMARDVAKSSNNFTNTLGLLGFAADETANDFQAMSYHDPATDHGSADDDALLGSEMDQKAYYELLMGRGFR